MFGSRLERWPGFGRGWPRRRCPGRGYERRRRAGARSEGRDPGRPRPARAGYGRSRCAARCAPLDAATLRHRRRPGRVPVAWTALRRGRAGGGPPAGGPPGPGAGTPRGRRAPPRSRERGDRLAWPRRSRRATSRGWPGCPPDAARPTGGAQVARRGASPLRPAPWSVPFVAPRAARRSPSEAAATRSAALREPRSWRPPPPAWSRRPASGARQGPQGGPDSLGQAVHRDLPLRPPAGVVNGGQADQAGEHLPLR